MTVELKWWRRLTRISGSMWTSVLIQQPDEAARMAAENDVHVVGISSLAGGHKTLLVQLVEELQKIGREHHDRRGWVFRRKTMIPETEWR